AVDGAKGVVRFRNGAIFFGELQEARPHGYGELYLSSVKATGTNRNRSRSSSGGGGGGSGIVGNSSANRRSSRREPRGSLAELDEMARDVLWYKGDFHLGKPHGSGVIKYKDPAPSLPADRGVGAAVAEEGRGGAGARPPGRPLVRASCESKDEHD
ncbi:unnamed protein product, partial [Ectocarpus sp. 12 AP-2014]